jgi:hypothetical protein
MSVSFLHFYCSLYCFKCCWSELKILSLNTDPDLRICHWPFMSLKVLNCFEKIYFKFIFLSNLYRARSQQKFRIFSVPEPYKTDI